jgi:OOP family OmpA-OmpF porin
MKVPEAEVGGHTDSISSEEFNQALSERRANAVVTALQERGVTTALSAQGYGESAPVAPNEVDGHDNPAGRQLNRRVEIFIPAF